MIEEAFHWRKFEALHRRGVVAIRQQQRAHRPLVAQSLWRPRLEPSDCLERRTGRPFIVCDNHEARLLQARRARVEGHKRPRLAPPDYALLHQLSEADWALLGELPLWWQLPEHDACIVHAGVIPDLPLAAQDPWTLTHIRSLDPAGQASERHDQEPWAARYRSGPHIIFGHNSRAGLQLQPRATGLDTGCVYGGRLSALVLAAGQHVPTDPEERRALVHSVPAARRYYAGKRAP